MTMTRTSKPEASSSTPASALVHDAAASDELSGLQRAILAAEDDDDDDKDDTCNNSTSLLAEWCRQRGNNIQVPLVERRGMVACPHAGGETSGTFTNHGTPLYIATVLDAPRAIQFLLLLLTTKTTTDAARLPQEEEEEEEEESDASSTTLAATAAIVNWKHPVHGDTCILHASERGYTDCLRALLPYCSRSKANHHVHRTMDRKLFLGQGLPQYQEGGLNPLHVAAVHGRLDVVRLLLDHDDTTIRNRNNNICWLQETDSFGRSLPEMVRDTLALKQQEQSSNVVRELEAIWRLLMIAIAKDNHHAKNKEEEDKDVTARAASGVQLLQLQIPSRGEAQRAERERQRALRARCLVAEQQKQAQQRGRGLKAVAESYQPLHPQVYCGKGNTEDGPLCFPDEALLINNQTKNQMMNVQEEPTPGVVVVPLLQREFCSLLWDELHHYEQTALSQPDLGLPLHTRHDGNLGNLQDCGFAPLLRALRNVCLPLIRRQLGERRRPNNGKNDDDDDDDDDDDLEVYHAFLTRNSPELEKNATFKLHCDKSDITLNICLHKSNDAVGSTVGFYEATNPEPHNQQDHFSDGGGGEPGELLKRVFTYEHQVGTAVIHRGSKYHKTDPIQCGTRGSLIVWARWVSANGKNRPKVGDVVSLAKNARVQSGVLMTAKAKEGGRGVMGVVLHDDQVSKQPYRVGHLVPERDGYEHSYYHVDDLIVVQQQQDKNDTEEEKNGGSPRAAT